MQLEQIDSRRILNLTLQREWFDKIYEKTKVEEYRNLTEYWAKHLEQTHNDPAYPGGRYQVVLFRNGYNPDSPRMWVEFKGLKKGAEPTGEPAYVIALGSILKVTDYDGPQPEKWRDPWAKAQRGYEIAGAAEQTQAATQQR